MTPATAKTVRRSICIALGTAALAAAGGAAGQAYYPAQTTTTYGPVTTYGPGYESTTTTTTTYDGPSTYAPVYESTTSAYAPAAPAYGTVYEDPGITVYGRPYRRGDDRAEVSERVRYDDLDLSTEAGASELRWRVDQSARSLCAQLGEPPAIEQNRSVLPSCQAAARDSAFTQVRDAIAAARYATPYYAYGR